MSISIRYCILMVLLFALLLPGVYCITVDTTSGGAAGTVGSSTTFEAPLDSDITALLVLGTGAKLSQSISGEGDLSQKHGASNKAGASVTVEASWSDSNSYTYSYDIYPREGTGLSSRYVQASEELSVDSATDLSAYAQAMNTGGDYAISRVEAGYGSLSGYKNSARAERSSAATTQTASYASLAVEATGSGMIREGMNAAVAARQNSADEFCTSMPLAISHANALESRSNAIDVEDERIAGFYSEAYHSYTSTLENYASGYITAFDPDGLGEYHDFSGYFDSTKSTKSGASASQEIGSVSGNWIQWGGTSHNKDGDDSFFSGGFGSSSMIGYSATEAAMQSSASSSQSIASLAATGSPGHYSQGFGLEGMSGNLQGDNTVSGIYSGSLSTPEQASFSGYSQSLYAKRAAATASQKLDSISGSSFETLIEASNAEKDSSSTSLGVTDGYVSKYSESASATRSRADISANIRSFSGYKANLKSHAENAKPAYEDLSEPVYYGGADFEIRARDRLTATVTSTASLRKGVLITPTLPSDTKTAILLEPFRRFAIDAGGTDTIYTAFPALAESGYAVTRYVDSAASKDKFKRLDKYNVVIVKSHMSPDTVGLSTIPNEIISSALSYRNPSSQSFIIMAGCESFEGYPTPSKLAKAVRKADLSAGYGESVYTIWNQDYIGELLTQMSTGKTAAEANDDIWNYYRYTWAEEHDIDPDDPYMCKLLLYGNGDFRL